MAIMRVTIFLPLLLIFFCLVSYEVSSDPKVVEGKTQHAVLGQWLKLSKYLNQGQNNQANNGMMGPTPTPALAPAPLDCRGLCSHRCSLHSRKNVCMRACGTCCIRCKCVPPGTFGNRDLCGKCYTGMTTHGNKTKCP